MLGQRCGFLQPMPSIRPNIKLAVSPRQRHLIFGSTGSGKTLDMLSIADWFREQGTQHGDYFISPQGGEDNLLRLYPKLDLVRLPVASWPDVRQWLRGYASLSKFDREDPRVGLTPANADPTWPGLASIMMPGDRLYVDMGNDIEGLLRNYYCVKQHGQTYAEIVAYHQHKDREGKLLGIPSGFDDIDPAAYPKLNVLSEEAFGWVTARSGLNLFVTTAESEIQYKADGVTPRYKPDKSFLPIGATPTANRYLQYDVDTFVHKTATGGSYFMQTVKKVRGVVGSDKPSKQIKVTLDGGGYWFAYCDLTGLDPYSEPGV